MAEQAKKAAPKRKPAARKPVAKRKPAVKSKPAAKRKPAARKPATKRAAPKKSASDFATRAQETGRNAFLAGLGFYGKAFDQAQERMDTLQSDLESNRKKADKMYKELVKRGQKVEKKALKAINEIELPKLELEGLTDRKKLEAQLEKAKARFEELKQSVSLKSAA